MLATSQKRLAGPKARTRCPDIRRNDSPASRSGAHAPAGELRSRGHWMDPLSNGCEVEKEKLESIMMGSDDGANDNARAVPAKTSRTPTTRVVGLSAEQREELEDLIRRGTTEHRLVQRARMVLLRADDVPVLEIARRLMVDRNNVWRWCDRYLAHGLEGLRDRPRPGRPRAGMGELG